MTRAQRLVAILRHAADRLEECGPDVADVCGYFYVVELKVTGLLRCLPNWVSPPYDFPPCKAKP